MHNVWGKKLSIEEKSKYSCNFVFVSFSKNDNDIIATNPGLKTQ